jgi:hypothetical protein
MTTATIKTTATPQLVTTQQSDIMSRLNNARADVFYAIKAGAAKDSRLRSLVNQQLYVTDCTARAIGDIPAGSTHGRVLFFDRQLRDSIVADLLKLSRHMSIEREILALCKLYFLLGECDEQKAAEVLPRVRELLQQRAEPGTANVTNF